MQPYAGWSRARGPYAAIDAAESWDEVAVHMAALGTPYAGALLNRVERGIPKDLPEVPVGILEVARVDAPGSVVRWLGH